MSDVERMSAMRCDREDDNTKVSPLDLVRSVAYDLESGAIKASSVFIVTADFPDEGEEWVFNTYRAGLNRPKEIMLIDLAHEKAIREIVD